MLRPRFDFLSCQVDERRTPFHQCKAEQNHIQVALRLQIHFFPAEVMHLARKILKMGVTIPPTHSAFQAR